MKQRLIDKRDRVEYKLCTVLNTSRLEKTCLYKVPLNFLLTMSGNPYLRRFVAKIISAPNLLHRKNLAELLFSLFPNSSSSLKLGNSGWIPIFCTACWLQNLRIICSSIRTLFVWYEPRTPLNLSKANTKRNILDHNR